MIEFNCTSCGKQISAGEDQAGQQCSCPYCSVVQVVPQAGGASAPPPPQAQGMPQAPGPYGGASAVQVASTGGKGLAVAALVLGLCSIVFSFLTGIPAIILGTIALSKGAKGKGLAVAGIVFGVVLPILALIMILVPSLTYARQLAYRAKCMANLRGIGQAITLYQAEIEAEHPDDFIIEQYPDDLNMLLREGTIPRKMLKCPAVDSGRDCDYFYRNPATGGAVGELGSFLACDFKGNHEDGRNVLRYDGTVTWMSEEQFQIELSAPENAAFAEALRDAEAGM